MGVKLSSVGPSDPQVENDIKSVSVPLLNTN